MYDNLEKYVIFIFTCSVLKFIYVQEVPQEEDEYNRFIELAQKLDVKGLPNQEIADATPEATKKTFLDSGTQTSETWRSTQTIQTDPEQSSSGNHQETQAFSPVLETGK